MLKTSGATLQNVVAQAIKSPGFVYACLSLSTEQDLITLIKKDLRSSGMLRSVGW
jgi:hypothetical protein